MKTPDGRHIVHIVCLDVRIVLPLPGEEGPLFWFRGHSGSRGDRRDAANRRDEKSRRKKNP
jgi:hypothetical protein